MHDGFDVNEPPQLPAPAIVCSLYVEVLKRVSDYSGF
jgi:hypothetical protein